MEYGILCPINRLETNILKYFLLMHLAEDMRERSSRGKLLWGMLVKSLRNTVLVCMSTTENGWYKMPCYISLV